MQTREQRQLPFSSCLGSGKKRRTGASIKISKAGAALRKQSRPVVKGESYESKDCLAAVRELKELGVSVQFEEQGIDTSNN